MSCRRSNNRMPVGGKRNGNRSCGVAKPRVFGQPQPPQPLRLSAGVLAPAEWGSARSGDSALHGGSRTRRQNSTRLAVYRAMDVSLTSFTEQYPRGGQRCSQSQSPGRRPESSSSRILAIAANYAVGRRFTQNRCSPADLVLTALRLSCRTARAPIETRSFGRTLLYPSTPAPYSPPRKVYADVSAECCWCLMRRTLVALILLAACPPPTGAAPSRPR